MIEMVEEPEALLDESCNSDTFGRAPTRPPSVCRRFDNFSGRSRLTLVKTCSSYLGWKLVQRPDMANTGGISSRCRPQTFALQAYLVHTKLREQLIDMDSWQYSSRSQDYGEQNHTFYSRPYNLESASRRHFR